MQLYPYLTFNGNCRKAMAFYKKCLGGELIMQTVGESPMANKLPMEMKAYILHCTLVTKGFIIMGSDMTPETNLIKGNNNALMLKCDSEKEIISFFKSLSAGGQVRSPLETTFWGTLFGEFTDRFGNHWILSFAKNSNHIKNIKHEKR